MKLEFLFDVVFCVLTGKSGLQAVKLVFAVDVLNFFYQVQAHLEQVVFLQLDGALVDDGVSTAVATLSRVVLLAVQVC